MARRSFRVTGTNNAAKQVSVDYQNDLAGVIERGVTVTPQDFGAVADDSTDDSAAFTAALEYLRDNAVSGYGYSSAAVGKLFIPKGHYYLGTTPIDIYGTLIIEGETGSGPTGGGTVLRWAADTSGIRAQNASTSGDLTYGATGLPSSIGSIIRNLYLQGANTGTNEDKAGIRIKAPIVVQDVFIDGFAGSGIRANANVSATDYLYGNANVSRLDRVWVQNCYHGFHLQGADANAASIYGGSTALNRGYGFFDESFLGNTWIACHAATNTLGGYRSVGASQAPLFIGCYDESDQPACSFSAKTQLIGGFWAAGTSGGGAIQTTNNLVTVYGLQVDRGAVQLLLDDTQGCYMRMGSNGVGATQFTTRSLGSKIVYYDALSDTANDFSVGVDLGGAALWHTVPTTDYKFTWYGGTTLFGTLDNGGINLPSGKALKVNGTQVVGAQGAAVADATDAASAITQLNALLARLRTHGLIAT